MGVDSESLVHFFRISFQRMHEGMDGDETTFTEASTQSHSVSAHQRSKGSTDALVPYSDSADLEQ